MNQSPETIEILDAEGKPIENVYRFTHDAMSTTFEIFINHEDSKYAWQCAMETFKLLDRLEQDLSRFIENSDISRINSLKPGQSVTVSLETFECLKKAALIWQQTDGAFDITVGNLVKCWLNDDKKLRNPDNMKLSHARQVTGMNLLKLDEQWLSVSVSIEGVCVDLGGIGKGFALDRMAEVLKQWNLHKALLHGGSSTALALNPPGDLSGWPITLSNPLDRNQVLEKINLNNTAASGSGLEYGRHIIDPRTAKPTKGKAITWSLAKDAATADALSTAFMVMDINLIESFCKNNSEVSALITVEDKTAQKDKIKIFKFGKW